MSIEKFLDLLKVDSLKECENYITDLFVNQKISYESFNYYLGIIIGFSIGFSIGATKSST